MGSLSIPTSGGQRLGGGREEVGSEAKSVNRSTNSHPQGWEREKGWEEKSSIIPNTLPTSQPSHLKKSHRNNSTGERFLKLPACARTHAHVSKTRARSKVDAANNLLHARRAALAALELSSEQPWPSEHTQAELRRAWRLYRMAERRAFEVTGR